MTDQEAALEAVRFRVKAEIRKRMRALRNALPAEARRQRAQAACAQIIAQAVFTRARTVLAYAALPGELDVTDVVQAALAQGKQVVLPRTRLPTAEPDQIVEPGLDLHAFRRGDDLEPGAFGVPEPRADSPRVTLQEVDLAIVPALALDPRGHRIGYGQGYYDRLLTARPDACTVGVVYDFQLIPEVPNTAHDVPLALVITDRRVLNPASP